MAIGLATEVVKVWKIAMAVGFHKWAEAMTLVFSFIYLFNFNRVLALVVEKLNQS